jgi:hypothetical protein
MNLRKNDEYRYLSPLPEGEGQGEGERIAIPEVARPPAASCSNVRVMACVAFIAKKLR